ncbi:sterol desaturase family protein [Phaeodactylibacter luteus]|uniref:Sterol desaturase family protein n=1 Tax=Phaeodactylibacter luteus TaxID=1564516 RepID=A0A5C6RM21_9BACT|nr:sterol desaturase family protein [Phaeodactylibacter luteus]TXB62670.1 sterol desaturase family protein [Phaeodactylibacter luteus]
MENFLAFFETMPAWQKLAWVFACLSISWLLEGAAPLVSLNYKKWKHASVNLVFLSTSLVINLLFTFATAGVFIWAAQAEFGLLYWISLPVWAELLLAVMLLDFLAQYVAHYLLHKVKWMWKFHLVHHSDTKVDATTGTRHHPGDYVIREVFALAGVVLFGIPLAYYLFYRIATILFTYLTHANITVPQWLDKPLSLLFITPNMHKFHHHFERPWTDSNFGNIFSLWDRAFGTFVYDDPRKVRYGVDVLEDSLDENLAYQFKVPFDKRVKTDY